MTVDLSGSLHSHTFHTDYRNPNERSKSPFDLGYFVRRCMEYGRNFQAVTDIRAQRPGFPAFDEQRYVELIKTADPNDNSYELEASKTEARVYIPSTREVFYILRTQEVLTNVPKKHVLAVNVGDMPGGESPEETLKRIKGGGGFAIIDHPFMCGAWNEDEIHRAYEVGLIGAIEWNGGLTFPACLDLIPGLKYKT
ncbi:MAG: hypothetical protein ACE5ES_03245, partial [Candidatus Nanoarchaeia archaeon]